MLIVGHEEVIERLKSHPLGTPVLLAGPHGIGKRLVAREYVEFLAQNHGLTSFGVSFYPRRVDGRWFTPMEAVKQIQYETSRRLSSSGAIQRAIVIDMDFLNEQAANALLTILETPPPGVQFILRASKPVIPTIASRCMEYRLNPLTTEQVLEILQSLAFEGDLRAYAEASGGSVGRAIEIAERMKYKARVQAILQAISKESVATVSSVLGAMNRPAEGSMRTWAEFQKENDATISLLKVALMEWRTRQFKLFKPDEMEGFERFSSERLDAALRILTTKARPILRLKMVVDVLNTKRTA